MEHAQRQPHRTHPAPLAARIAIRQMVERITASITCTYCGRAHDNIRPEWRRTA